MISTAYLKYLFRSKRYLLGFLLLVTVLFALMTTGKMAEFGSWLVTVIAAFLSIGLPCVVFSYVHNKKSVDTFYSLNVSRRELLFTGLLFCFLTVFCPRPSLSEPTAIPSRIMLKNFPDPKGLQTS